MSTRREACGRLAAKVWIGVVMVMRHGGEDGDCRRLGSATATAPTATSHVVVGSAAAAGDGCGGSGVVVVVAGLATGPWWKKRKLFLIK